MSLLHLKKNALCLHYVWSCLAPLHPILVRGQCLFKVGLALMRFFCNVLKVFFVSYFVNIDYTIYFINMLQRYYIYLYILFNLFLNFWKCSGMQWVISYLIESPSNLNSLLNVVSFLSSNCHHLYLR